MKECSQILMQKLEEVRAAVNKEESEKAEIEKNLAKITAEEDQLNGNVKMEGKIEK
jgi:hypothetical protein